MKKQLLRPYLLIVLFFLFCGSSICPCYSAGSVSRYKVITSSGTPTITLTVLTGSISACAGSPSASPDIEQFTFAGGNLTSNITLTAPTGFEISFNSASGFSTTLTAAPSGGNVNSTSVYVRSAAGAVGSISGVVKLVTAGIPQHQIGVNGLVTPPLSVNSIPNQTVIKGGAIAPVNFAGSTGEFFWTNNTPGIGLAANGVGNIPSFNVTNSTTPLTATITVTPAAGGYAYVVSRDGNGVYVVNTITDQEIKFITTGSANGAEPLGVAASPDGSKVYVTNYLDNTLAVISTASNSVIATIPVGQIPYGVAVSPDGSRVYVTNDESKTVSVISSASNTVISTIALSASPSGIVVGRDGSKLYVTNGNNISVINISTGQVTANIGLAGGGGLAVSNDGTRLFVSGTPGVAIINTASNTILKTVSLAGGNGLALSVDGSKVYAGGPNGLAVINTVTSTLDTTITAAANAYGISVTPDGSRIYATDGAENAYIISTANNAIVNTLTNFSGSGSLGNYIVPAPLCTGPSTTFTISVNSTGTTLPIISYSSPQTYAANLPITSLTPASSGVAAKGYSGTPVSFGSGFSSPFGIAVDAAGNTYVADQGNNAIKKIAAGGATPVIIGSGFNAPSGVAVDGAGNIYVADQGNGAVKKMSSTGGSMTTLGSGFSSPTGIALDGAGNIYVADADKTTITKIPAAGGNLISLGSGFNAPTGVAVDAAGNIYVADAGNYAVKEIPAAGGAPITLGSGFNSPSGVAVDALGNVFVADQYNSAVKWIPAGGGAPVAIGSGFNYPAGVAVDATGDIFIADELNNAVKEVSQTGGYIISPALPAGLSFDSNTGIISGTPTVISPATNYVVTAFNAYGKGSAILNITVNAPVAPTISYSGTFSYTLGVPITPVTPVSTGIAPAGYNNTPVIIGSGFNKPYSSAVDNAGNIYVADQGNNAIKKIPAAGGTPVAVGTGFSQPTGIVIDKTGNIYVADKGNNVLKEIPVGSNSPAIVSVQSGVSNPGGIALDGKGSLYLANTGQNSVEKITAPYIQTNIGAGFNSPWSVSADVWGNVFVADLSDKTITKIPVDGSAAIALGSGFNSPHGVTVDGSGNIFVADYGNNTVKEIPADNSAVITIGSGFSSPTGVTTDAAGNLYVTDNGNNAIKKFTPVGGYYISPALPPGLVFNNGTGIISGTPLKGISTVNTVYTIWAYNAAGTGVSTTLTIATSAPKPIVGYNNPVVVTKNVAVNLVPSSNSGIAPLGYNYVPTPVISGLTHPANLAIGYGDGGIYVTPEGTTIQKYPANGAAPVTIGAGFNEIGAMAVDAAGNVYVCELSSNINPDVKEIPVGGGAPIIIDSGYLPEGIAVDAAGNVYIGNGSTHGITMIPVGGGAKITLAAGIASPIIGFGGLAVDGLGNVYATSGGNIYKVPAGGGTPISLAAANFPFLGIAVDGAGNIFAADGMNNNLYEIPAGTTTLTLLNISKSASPSFAGVAVDRYGAIYFADTGTVLKVTPSGGYFLDKTLPAGLNFSNTTGIVSGTPTTLSPATSYYVSGYNAGGSFSNSTLNLKVAASPALSGLAVSSGSLTPLFSTNTVLYTDTVINFIKSLQITPTTVDPSATVAVNGTVVASGTGSTGIPLNVGANAISIVVTAADGATTKTYTLTVYRAFNFAAIPAQTYGDQDVIPGASSTAGTITYTSSDPLVATIVLGKIHITGAGSANIIATDGFTTLSQPLTVAPAALTLTANNQTMIYGSAVPSLTFSCSGFVNGETPSSLTTPPILSTSATSSAQAGTYPILISGAVDPNYSISYISGVITVAAAPVATLSSLTVSAGKLSPVFSKGTLAYTDTIPNSASSIVLTPVLADPTATMTVNGTPSTSGSGVTIPIAIGSYKETIVVTAGNGVQDTYTVKVTRLSSNANLSALTVNQGKLSPAFVLTTTTYTDTIPNSSTSVTITPTLSNSQATMMINGTSSASGSAFTVPVAVGSYKENIVVTAQDGTQTTYTVKVTRLSSNANLSALTVNQGKLSPAFVLTTTTYTDTIPNSSTSVTITPTLSNSQATMTVNGVSSVSGQAIIIPVAVGNNKESIIVKAQDGTLNTYMVTIHRLSPAGLNSIYTQEQSELSTFERSANNDKPAANNILSPNGDGINDIWIVKNIANYPNNMVTVYDRTGRVIYTKKNYQNDWAGTYQGSVLSEGTYYYLVDLGNGSNIKGFITVVRDR